jgi:DNA-binding HxlR family transcriptional regulator
MADLRDICSVARTLGIVGEKWTLLVLREAFMGQRRFADMQRDLGVSKPVLAQRLTRLVDEGILRRVPYQEPGDRVRHEYKLTRKGMDLYPILVALVQWGDRYLADESGPPLLLEHRDCGGRVQTSLACDAGHVLESARDVAPRPGPGVRASA